MLSNQELGPSGIPEAGAQDGPGKWAQHGPSQMLRLELGPVVHSQLWEEPACLVPAGTEWLS